MSAPVFVRLPALWIRRRLARQDLMLGDVELVQLPGSLDYQPLWRRPALCDCQATNYAIRTWATAWRKPFTRELACPACGCSAGAHRAGSSHRVEAELALAGGAR